ncbi:MAG TPA: M20/M25/M40 family metallo-hydrolase [Candidatus Cloacimonadota bacterium]|nr:M20/M25/M40 family metallo-hydrolase [Candidatus Cloacimonadota bacterium]
MEQTVIEYFLNLIKIDSESKNEKATAEKLSNDLRAMGAEIKFDNAHEKVGGNVGNLYAFFPGKIEKTPLIFCAHMDTVKPGNGIKPQIKDDIIVSDGSTILGSDDKSGIAEIIWGIKALQESDYPYAPLELLFTISEEIGLLGAKNVDYSLLQGKIGYAMDGHEVGKIYIGAPSQKTMKFVVHGKESHAGIAPEKGINAIKVAADALAAMPSGRIDFETTCNVGLISGGKATNIVPNEVVVEAEARSHNSAKLENLVQRMIDAFQTAVTKYEVDGVQAKVEIEVQDEYQNFRLTDDDEAVILAKQAAKNLAIPYEGIIGGGGSDVNMFNKHGMKLAVGGTGMEHVHTVKEQIRCSDLELSARWVSEIITLYSEK